MCRRLGIGFFFVFAWAIEIVHGTDFVTHADRSTPVQWLAATLGPNHAIALLLVLVVALGGIAYRLWHTRPATNRVLRVKTGRTVIEEHEETHRVRITRQIVEDDGDG